MELRELVSQTREAMEDGHYSLAVTACEHMLETYPTSLVAHRMLGEALVEQGALDAADEHFMRVLSIDPLNPVAHLGLGVAAEERNDSRGAYAHYLNAWEMHPELDHLRDELVRLRAAADEDPRLHPTRSALATLYARGGQTRRAVAEWRSVIGDDPANMPARLALAELLWRTGDDSGALTASQEVLEHLPDCARALAIVADIERRGDGETSPERIDHYRSLDPTGEIALELSSVSSDKDVGFLIEDTVHIPDFNAAEVDPPADVSVADGEHQGSVTGTSASEVDPWAGLIREISADTNGPHEGGEATAVPFSWDDIGTADDDDSDPLAAQVEAARPPGAESDAKLNGEDLGLLSDVDLIDPSIQPFNFEDEAGSNATGELPSENGEWFGLGDDVVPAEALDDAVQPAVTERVFATGGSIDLTAGWDDLDRVLHEALPSDSSLQEYEGLIEAFNVEGITPLDPGTLGSEDEWKPLSAEEWGVDDDEPEAVSADSSAAGNGPADTEELDEFAILDRLAQDSSFEQDPGAAADAAADDLGLSEADLALSASWHGPDDDSGIPRAGVDGYTAILRSLDFEQPLGDDAEQADRPDENDSGPLPADDQRSLEEAAVGQTGAVTAPGGRGDADIIGGEDEPHMPLTSSVIIGEASNRDTSSHEYSCALGNSGPETETDVGFQSLEDGAEALDRERATREDRETSPWPRFAAGIGGLSEASGPAFQLLAQMREEKASLVELGVLTVDRRLARTEHDAVSHAADEDGGDGGVGPRSEASTPSSLGRERVRAFRSRLAGDLSNVEATARELEELAAGGHGAAVSRLLGEAYLRLGRPTEAADLFRLAIVQRGHFR